MYVPVREEEVFRKLEKLAEGGLLDSAIRGIYREIISASIALEKRLVIGYLPMRQYTRNRRSKNFGTSVNYQPYNTIPDVFYHVQKGEADYGVGSRTPPRVRSSTWTCWRRRI